MKTPIFRLLVIVLVIAAYSCKNEPSIDYKYGDTPNALACDINNSKLYNEAIHSFENDIVAFFDKTGNNKSKAYAGFINGTMNNRNKFDEIVSKHSLNLALALKQDTNLWSNEGPTTLNYSHPIVDCIANNIKTQYLKQTFNALLATNSMRKNVVLPPLQSATRSIPTDGSLIAFLAFEYYYPNVWNIKPEDIKTPANNTSKIDFNKTPVAPKVKPQANTKDEKDPHAGHNHN